MFAERGVASATLAQVASRAGLTRGAVYHHFTDKIALLTAALDEPWDTVAAPAFAELDGPDTADRPLRQRLAAFAEAWLAALRSDHRFLALMTVSLDAGPALRRDERAKEIEVRGYLDWRDRLHAALATEPAIDDPKAVADHLLAWLTGTAQLAGTDQVLLPPPGSAATLIERLLP